MQGTGYPYYLEGSYVTTTATIVGNLASDPSLRFTAAGKPVTSFGVAVGRRKKNDAGKWEDDGADFYDVTCWDSLAENVAESLEKGNRVVVTGRLRQETWEKDGDKRSKVSVTSTRRSDAGWAMSQTSFTVCGSSPSASSSGLR